MQFQICFCKPTIWQNTTPCRFFVPYAKSYTPNISRIHAHFFSPLLFGQWTLWRKWLHLHSGPKPTFFLHKEQLCFSISPHTISRVLLFCSLRKFIIMWFLLFCFLLHFGSSFFSLSSLASSLATQPTLSSSNDIAKGGMNLHCREKADHSHLYFKNTLFSAFSRANYRPLCILTLLKHRHTGAKINFLSRNSQEFHVWKMWIL